MEEIETSDISCSCGRDVAPTCPIHGEGALARRNDRFYYYASIPWSADDHSRSRWIRLVDLLGVDVRISWTQNVYIATTHEALEFERLFGPILKKCGCGNGTQTLRGDAILYGGGSNGIYVPAFFDLFDSKSLKKTPTWPADKDRLHIEWGDVDPTSRMHGEQSLWEMRISGVRVFSVWHVTPYMMETALLVLAEERRWKERLEAYRTEQRRVRGVVAMRKECGLPAPGETR